jgi:hypothetical protein
LQGKLDTHPNNFGPRLRAYVEGRGTIEQAYEEIGVSRATLFNWFERDTPPPGETKKEKLRRYLGNEAHRILDGIQAPRLKSGGKPAAAVEEEQDKFRTVASRIPQRRTPSTRQDCEAYVQQLFDAAEESDNPNAFPVIFDLLTRELPLDKWRSKIKDE